MPACAFSPPLECFAGHVEPGLAVSEQLLRSSRRFRSPVSDRGGRVRSSTILVQEQMTGAGQVDHFMTNVALDNVGLLVKFETIRAPGFVQECWSF